MHVTWLILHMPLHAGMQVEDLARLSFKQPPMYVGIDDKGPAATREGLEQGYCVVPSAQRFLLLFTFLKRNAGKKVAIAPLFACMHNVKLHPSCLQLGVKSAASVSWPTW